MIEPQQGRQLLGCVTHALRQAQRLIERCPGDRREAILKIGECKDVRQLRSEAEFGRINLRDGLDGALRPGVKLRDQSQVEPKRRRRYDKLAAKALIARA